MGLHLKGPPGETFLILSWSQISPSPASLLLEHRNVPAPWSSAVRVPLAPTASGCTLDGLLPTATYECRLVADGAVVGDVVAFDTLPAGCGGSDGKKGGACALS
jgi:hypothetical protein